MGHLNSSSPKPSPPWERGQGEGAMLPQFIEKLQNFTVKISQKFELIS